MSSESQHLLNTASATQQQEQQQQQQEQHESLLDQQQQPPHDHEHEQQQQEEHPPENSRVGFWLLLLVAFVSDTAGASGVEDAIASGGPLWTLLLIILIPFTVCLSTLAMCWELLELYPVSNHGYVRWVADALGPRIAFCCCLVLGASQVVDTASYVFLAQAAFSALMPPGSIAATSGVFKYFLRVVIIVVFGSLNLFGVRQMGVFSVCIGVIVVSGYLASIGWFEWRPDLYAQTIADGPSPGPLRLSSLLSISTWLYSGTLISASLVDEAESVSVLMKSWFASLFLEAAMYLLPTLTALPAKIGWADWDAEGSDGGENFVQIFSKMNRGLGVYIGVGTALANIGLFSANILYGSRFWWAMADRHLRWLPAALSRRNRWQSPYVIVILMMLVALILNLFDFSFIIENEIVLLALNHIVFVIAFCQLRLLYPVDLIPRSNFTIPLGIGGVFLTCVPRLGVRFLQFSAAG